MYNAETVLALTATFMHTSSSSVGSVGQACLPPPPPHGAVAVCIQFCVDAGRRNEMSPLHVRLASGSGVTTYMQPLILAELMRVFEMNEYPWPADKQTETQLYPRSRVMCVQSGIVVVV